MERSLLVGDGPRPYLALEEYGAIGQGESVALVSRHGSIDWWCPHRFDAPSVFGAILDGRLGGRYRVAPTSLDARSTMRYVTDTNVLETTHETSTGAVRVVDSMPFHADLGVDNDVILRRVTGLRGAVELLVEWAPRFQYGRVAPRFAKTPLGLLARGAGEIMILRGVDLDVSGGVPCARVVVKQGETVELILRHRPFDTPVPFSRALAAPPAELEAKTIERWHKWAARTRVTGPDEVAVRRAALALKLLQSARTGAIVAAPTTSLPEELGGVRNWDYRYAWIRDAALSAKALADLGHEEDAFALASWLARAVQRDQEDVRIMYTVGGARELPESELPHLAGYRNSAPVRVGNGAYTQRQLDVYGELFDFVSHLHRAWTSDEWAPFRKLADWVCDHWREPDSGIWEMRSAPRHFVLSKAMAWVALTRAAHLARKHDLPGDAARWSREADVVRADVLDQGYDREVGAFVQAYGHKRLDASNLLLPLVGFVDANDPRMVGTVQRTLETLTKNGLVYRYIDADDGVAGGEATFAYCTFWLIEVLAKQGRARDARALFDRMLARATPLGLYAEEIDADTGAHLGNFPQGFPHAGLIQAALALRAAERDEPREEPGVGPSASAVAADEPAGSSSARAESGGLGAAEPPAGARDGALRGAPRPVDPGPFPLALGHRPLGPPSAAAGSPSRRQPPRHDVLVPRAGAVGLSASFLHPGPRSPPA